MLARVSFVIALVLALATGVSAQWVQHEAGDVATGRIMVRLTPTAANSLMAAFAEGRDPKLNLNQVKVADGTLVSELLGLPSQLAVTGIKPFIAQNSVVFPDIREKMNPGLFLQHAAPILNDNTAQLRQNEDKVARWFELHYSASITPQAAALLLKKNHLIEIAEPRYIRHTQFVPNDSLLSQQFHLAAMNIFEAWDHVRCDTNTIIANVDVGVDWTHPDLNPSIKKNWGEMGLDAEGNEKWSNAVDDDGNGFIDDWHGWDFAGPFGETSDNDARPDRDNPDNHGTHTTGISAALANNHKGIAGIAFGAAILPIKAADNFGSYISFGYEGIAYAANMGVRIVNCSWGGQQRSDAENDVIQYAYSKNTLVIAAAGNHYRHEDFYPASYEHVLSVTSVSGDGERDIFSNISYHVDVAAPGMSILSTVPFEGYAFLNGTSMSTPQVAGAAALILAKDPTLSAGQLGEVIRASAKGNTDSTTIDLMGRGLIDINRAVTDNNLFSARIEKVDIFDDNDDKILAAGETGAIVIKAINYLKQLPSLKAKIEFIRNGEYVLTNTKELIFGLSNTLSTVQNLKADFRFLVADSTPVSAEVTVKVSFFDEATGYGPDPDFFSFVINPDYRDLNANNLTVTFDSKAGMGYSDPVEHTKGSGFMWRNSPPEIPSQGRSVLYQSGLMMSADDERVVSLAPGEWSETATRDFATLSRINAVIPPDHKKALQELHTSYDDTNALDSLEVGVTIDQRSYAFGGEASDAIVVDYRARKRPMDDPDLDHTDETTMALYMDWDIGPSGAMNITRFDTGTKTAYLWRQESEMPYVAVRVISELPEGAELNFHAIQNNGSEGIVGTYDGMTNEEKRISMTVERDSAGMADVSQVFGLKNVPLKSADKIVLTYVMGLGVDEASAKRTIDDAEKQWKSIAAVASEAGTVSLRVFPNPFVDRISFILPDASQQALVRLIDVTGRVVLQRQLSSAATSLEGLDLHAGSYILEIEQAGITYRSQVVKQ
jgi:serine protease